MPDISPVVSCPNCAKEVPWSTQNPFRPFCCERCKLIDLGKWANEEYKVERPLDYRDLDDL